LNLDEIKQFLRIDWEEEDILLSTLQQAAEEYLTNAGVNKNYSKALYKLAIQLLISNWYENRSTVLIGSISKKIEFSLQAIITQLVYTQEVI